MALQNPYLLLSPPKALPGKWSGLAASSIYLEVGSQGCAKGNKQCETMKITPGMMDLQKQ